MMNRQKLMAAAVAAAFGAAAAGTGNALAAGMTTAPVSINGQEVQVRSIQDNGQQLLSISDLAHALGAELEVLPAGAGLRITLDGHTLLIKPGAKEIAGEEGNVSLTTAVTSWKRVSYIELFGFAKALGAKLSNAAGKLQLETMELLASAESVQWAGEGRLIASASTEEGRGDYFIDAATGMSSQLLTSSGASELVISPDGAAAAFTEADGTLRLLDLATLRITKASSDTSMKSNLQWSPDGKRIYFLQGDKTAVIAAIGLEDGKLIKILDDKVEFKGDLSVNGSGLVYSVVKTGKVTADSGKEVELDDVAIDTSGTNPQLFELTLGTADAKPVSLTNEDTDKLFIQRSAAGTVYYVRAGDETANSVLIAQKDGKASTVFDKEDVLEAVQAGGFIGILTDSSVYVLDESNGSVARLADAPEGAYGLALVKNGKGAAVIADGQLLKLTADGKWMRLSQ